MSSILLVEDSEDIVALIEANISDLGFPITLDIATDGDSGLQKALVGNFAMLILDIDLPIIDGFSICKRLRQEGKDVPILMLTGRDSLENKIEGLEAGADDYLTKPFSTNELLARIRAMLRRSNFDPLGNEEPSQALAENRITHGELELDLDTREVWLSKELVKLSKSEFDVLCIMAKQPGRVFSRSELLRAVFGYEHENYESNVNTLITRLRQKVEPDSSKPKYILTQWGIGYRFSTIEELESSSAKA